MASFSICYSLYTVKWFAVVSCGRVTKGYGLMVIEFYSALNGLHEIHMKALRTPRCITHLNMRAIRQCAGCCLEASTNGFIWFKVRDYRES